MPTGRGESVPEADAWTVTGLTAGAGFCTGRLIAMVMGEELSSASVNFLGACFFAVDFMVKPDLSPRTVLAA